ncbi:hypothetical protein AB4520_11910 [Vibrio renipiscarius]|uniref:hypothetical protein n=1 Tax=Vibrio renipiscarius TaxID=1461322 RepID=UPI00354CBB75
MRKLLDYESTQLLGINIRYLWMSALSPTSRVEHVIRHGEVYTEEEIVDFYKSEGNDVDCKCSFSEVVCNENGNPKSTKLIEKLKAQKQEWFSKY